MILFFWLLSFATATATHALLHAPSLRNDPSAPLFGPCFLPLACCFPSRKEGHRSPLQPQPQRRQKQKKKRQEERENTKFFAASVVLFFCPVGHKALATNHTPLLLLFFSYPPKVAQKLCSACSCPFSPLPSHINPSTHFVLFKPFPFSFSPRLAHLESSILICCEYNHLRSLSSDSIGFAASKQNHRRRRLWHRIASHRKQRS